LADDREEAGAGPAPVVLAHRRPFRLGRVEVRPSTREVIGPAGAEIVEPRVMQVLVALASAEGEILSRDDLIQACWEGRIVGENAIDRVISRLRRLAETVGQGSFRIETITKVGYRLLPERAAGDPPLLADAPRPLGRTSGIDRRALIWGGTALAVGAAAVWVGVRLGRPEVPEPAVRLHDRGVEALRRGWAEDVASAIGLFREAVTIAPDYAEAWGMLALAYQISLEFAPADAAPQVHERARSAARRALELDPDNVEALAAQAIAVPIYRNWARSEATLRRVLDRDPAQVETSGVLSRVLADVGRMAEAVAILERVAEAVSALPFHQYWLAWLLFCANRLEDSDRVIDRALAMWPRQFAVWFTRGWLYAFTGRAAQALALVGDAANRPVGIPERDFEIVESSVRAIATRGSADIEAALRANLAAAPDGTGYCTNAIKVGAYLGRLDEAFAAAEALYFGRGFRVQPNFFTPQQGGFTPPQQRRTEFLFSSPCAPMRADPRFRPLLEEIGLADYWRATGTAADVLAGG
jgi:DNA-binding winged helix-turn-helix (wHTH) protein/tetratricopeptide (TPR) repeat protein